MMEGSENVENQKQDPIRCAYIIPRKKRPCKMLVKKGQKYCGEHTCFDPDNEFRIPCPNDPHHSVDKRQLDEHLAKCNARVPDHPYVSKNINMKPVREEVVPEDITEEIFFVSEIIQKEYQNIKPNIAIDCRSTDVIEDLSKETAKLKHLKQISSIIAHLRDNEFLSNDKSTGILELGVGRGQLAYHMAKMAPETRFVLIDYSGVKHKVDNKLKVEENGDNYQIHRIRCPIEHVDVTKLDVLKTVDSFAAVCKHFCGSATDYGINLISKAVEADLPLTGFCLVPCCRHRISVDQYTGSSYLTSIGISSDAEFAALKQIASWATCGAPVTATSVMEANDDGNDYKFWSYPKKLDFGKKAQALMVDCYVGSATGAFKTVDFKHGKITNVNKISELEPKKDEITAMCWGDCEQTEIITVQTNRKLKVYNELTNLYSDLFTVEGGEGPVKSVRWLKDSESIVTAVNSGILAIWTTDGRKLSPENWSAGSDLLAMEKNPWLNQIATGGKENILKIWDLEKHEKIHVALNYLHHRVPIWETGIKYLNENEIVTTTGKSHVRVYDFRADQRPIQEFTYMDTPITALSLCYKDRHIVVGNTTGNVSIFDLRNTKNQVVKLRGFAGSVRSIDAHPTTPFVVSVGVDRHVRLHDIQKKKLIKKIYAKVHLNTVLFKKENNCEKVKPDDMRWEKSRNWDE